MVKVLRKSPTSGIIDAPGRPADGLTVRIYEGQKIFYSFDAAGSPLFHELHLLIKFHSKCIENSKTPGIIDVYNATGSRLQQTIKKI